MPRRSRMLFACLIVGCLLGGRQTTHGQTPPAKADAATNAELFENEIRPLLVKHCLKCHGASKQESELRLDSAAAVRRGGENGPLLRAGKLDQSLLIQAVGYEGEIQMPPAAKLPAAEIAALRKWVQSGAAWPDGVTLGSSNPRLRGGPITDAERAFWSFQPLADATPPKLEDPDWSANGIDRFLFAKLAEEGMRPAKPASRRVWLRRATFDLTGLPPTAAEISDFLNDESPRAHDKVIDRLLASPAYGERWGRHWLDVVRYADTAGETADFPVREAYLYRNWVIDALNDDKPYDQFLREQLIGDLLGRDLAGDAEQLDEETLKRYAQLLTATGFIAISRRFGFDSQNYHNLTIQDTIDTLGQAVLGLSLGCARCHDHKYDPVNKEDYYALYGIFASTKYPHPGSEEKKRPADFAPAAPPVIAKRRLAEHKGEIEQWKSRIAAHAKRVASLRAAITRRARSEAFLTAVRPLLLSDGIPNVDGKRHFNAYRPRGAGLPLIGVNNSDTLLKVPGDVAPGGVVVHPDHNFGVGIVWQSPIDGEVAIAGRVADAHKAGDSVTWHVDHVSNARFAPLASGDVKVASFQMLESGQGGKRLAKLDVRRGDLIQLAIWKKQHIGADLTAIDLRVEERGGRGRKWNLATDIVEDLLEDGGGNPHSDSHGNADVWYFYKSPQDRGAAWVKEPEKKVELDAELVKADLDTLRSELAELDKQRADLTRRVADSERRGAYAVLYAAVEGSIEDARIQKRGDKNQLGERIPRRNLSILGGQPISDPKSHSGRRDLARWLTSPDNPLTPRVIVNRIWQHHFGDGLAPTENDFGVRGQRPSHPRLLDWLAKRFIDSGWSIKATHRLIMRTRAYRMSSEFNANYAIRDPDNRLLWHFSRRRLSAEEIRDSILAISGDLDETKGGPHPFPDVNTWGFTQHGPFYGLYETKRRSVYLMQQRLKRHPFLALFDGSDPNVATPQRIHTTTPTQALYLMNNTFVHEQSKRHARRLMERHDDWDERIRGAYVAALGRPPSEVELAGSRSAREKYQRLLGESGGDSPEQTALAALVRTLIVRNEFLFVD